MSRLQGKVAIITGATSGIGERTAAVFIEQGAAVVMAARSRAKGEALAQRLGARAIFVPTDVARESDLQALVQAAVARFGRIDCVFNNAGSGGRIPPIEQLEQAQIRSSLGLLFDSVLLSIKHVVPVMKRQGGGSIINNASVAAHRVGHGSILYSAAKAAVVSLTRTAAVELGPYNIRVNSISPGAIATPIFWGGGDLDQATTERTLAALEEVLERRVALTRSGVPDDIAKGALYLASDDASFVTGQDIVIDGGQICGRNVAESTAKYAEIAAAVKAARSKSAEGPPPRNQRRPGAEVDRR